MPGTREIQRRIKSISGTRKITKAMQMVSSAKMRRAQSAAVSSRTYSDLAREIISALSELVDHSHHPIFANNENVKQNGKVGNAKHNSSASNAKRNGNAKDNGDAKNKAAVILITTNRGLVGSLNANLVHEARQRVLAEGLEADMFTYGKKGRDAVLKIAANIAAEFAKPDRTPKSDEVLPLSKLVTEQYIQGAYKKVFIAYTHFVSTVAQKPVVRQLLPFSRISFGENGQAKPRLPEHFKNMNFEYVFEPDPGQVLDYLVPRVIESQIYQAILESDASEHSARMVMMKNATEAAGDLIEDLTLAYNRLRQANITKELAELTAGRIAVE